MGYTPMSIMPQYNKQYNFQCDRCAACEKEIKQQHEQSVAITHRGSRVYLCISCFQDNAPDELIEMLGIEEKESVFSSPIKKEVGLSIEELAKLAAPDLLIRPPQKPKHFVNVAAKLSETLQYYCISCNNAISPGRSPRLPNSFKIICNSCGAGIEEVYYHG